MSRAPERFSQRVVGEANDLVADSKWVIWCFEPEHMPKLKERPAGVELPPMTTAADAVAAMGAIVQAVSDGDLGVQEAGELAKVVAGFAQTVATAVVEQRLIEAEQAIALLKRK